jgi:hypothetical protein
MTALDIFALFILLVLLASGVGIWVLLGMLPGRIARERNHPQADAIGTCGWFGVITMGILCPLAFIWAYTTPGGEQSATGAAVKNKEEHEPEINA